MLTMSSRQLSEWMAFYELEPFGPEREDLRAGVIASTIANVNRTKKSSQTFKPGDFLLEFGEEEDDESVEEPLTDRERLKQKVLAIKGLFNTSKAGPNGHTGPPHN